MIFNAVDEFDGLVGSGRDTFGIALFVDSPGHTIEAHFFMPHEEFNSLCDLDIGVKIVSSAGPIPFWLQFWYPAFPLSQDIRRHAYNFADFAEHSGGLGLKVTEPSELRTAVDKALFANKPTIVDIDTDPRRFL